MILRRGLLLFLILFAIFTAPRQWVTAQSTATPQLTLLPTPTISPTPTIPEDLLNRINTLRASLNVFPLTLNDQLTAAANAHARWMANSGEVNHTEPDGSRPADRALAAGYQSLWCCGENIYMGMSDKPDNAWNFWINSEAHYNNLTSERYRELGVGVATAPSEYGTRTAFVLDFGMPANATALPITHVPRAEATYVVQRGDSLYSIATHYGMTVQELASANGLTNPDVLEVGQVLIIPGTITGTPPAITPTLVPSPIVSTAPSATSLVVPTALQPQTHIVQPGENLYRIALRYNVSLELLIAVNHITDPTRIYVGQTLIIP